MLSTLIFTPLIGAFVLYLLSIFTNICKRSIKILGLVISLITAAIAIFMWTKFDYSISELQFIEKVTWIDAYQIFYQLGVDGISLYFILLTVILIPICIIASWHLKENILTYLICFLSMESFVLGSFLATDFLLFYIFFEAVLIPMYFIIGIFGGENRIYAAYKFFLYTLAGSVLLLLAIVYIYYQTGTTDIALLTQVTPGFSEDVQNILWLLFFVSFAVKVPMFPFHTWLPDAHVQAPTTGSVILAGILLKLGGYGFLRFSLPMLPLASIYFADFIMYLSMIAVVYTSLVALMQNDMKKLIAYSSVAHMAFVTAGIFAFNELGIEGAIFQMISHGLVSGALFLCVGVLYTRMHTKEIAAYGGVTTVMPKFAIQFMLFMLASVGLPGTSGFIGEFTVLLGVFEYNPYFCAILATSLILGAAYMLWLFARVMYSEIANKKIKGLEDINTCEKITLWPIFILVIILGIYPSLILDGTKASVSKLVQHINNPVISSIQFTQEIQK